MELDAPGECGHDRVQRIGIQKSPFPPHRLYLVTCRSCGTTLTTVSLRKRKRKGKRGSGGR